MAARGFKSTAASARIRTWCANVPSISISSSSSVRASCITRSLPTRHCTATLPWTSLTVWCCAPAKTTVGSPPVTRGTAPASPLHARPDGARHAVVRGGLRRARHLHASLPQRFLLGPLQPRRAAGRQLRRLPISAARTPTGLPSTWRPIDGDPTRFNAMHSFALANNLGQLANGTSSPST